jgi:hypothetical protein
MPWSLEWWVVGLGEDWWMGRFREQGWVGRVGNLYRCLPEHSRGLGEGCAECRGVGSVNTASFVSKRTMSGG